MIPKHKLGGLVGLLVGKPKEDDAADEAEDKGPDSGSGDLKDRCDGIADDMLSAIKDDDTDALCEALLDLVGLAKGKEADDDEVEAE